MDSRKVEIERRRLGRFKPNPGIMVEFSKPRILFFFKSSVIKSVQVLDISTDGLAFEYEGRKMWTADFKELSISVNGDAEKVEGVPFTIISDHKIGNIPEAIYGRRCGVQFHQLASHHRAQIHHFITNYTTYIPKPLPKPVTKPKSNQSDNAKRTIGDAFYVELFRG